MTSLNPTSHAARPQGAKATRAFKHTKTGGIYEFVGDARLQTSKSLSDMAEVVVYQGQDGALWVRPREEFAGRFEPTDVGPSSDVAAKLARAWPVPKGFKLTPIEPTGEMINAGHMHTIRADEQESDHARHQAIACYTGMLAAAPAPTAPFDLEPTFAASAFARWARGLLNNLFSPISRRVFGRVGGDVLSQSAEGRSVIAPIYGDPPRDAEFAHHLPGQNSNGAPHPQEQGNHAELAPVLSPDSLAGKEPSAQAKPAASVTNNAYVNRQAEREEAERLTQERIELRNRSQREANAAAGGSGPLAIDQAAGDRLEENLRRQEAKLASKRHEQKTMGRSL